MFHGIKLVLINHDLAMIVDRYDDMRMMHGVILASPLGTKG